MEPEIEFENLKPFSFKDGKLEASDPGVIALIEGNAMFGILFSKETPIPDKGQELLQELVEKCKAKEPKPLLTDIFIQMLRDRENKGLAFELCRIKQILKNL